MHNDWFCHTNMHAWQALWKHDGFSQSNPGLLSSLQRKVLMVEGTPANCTWMLLPVTVNPSLIKCRPQKSGWSLISKNLSTLAVSFVLESDAITFSVYTPGSMSLKVMLPESRSVTDCTNTVLVWSLHLLVTCKFKTVSPSGWSITN